jgi:hypothetical protein
MVKIWQNIPRKAMDKECWFANDEFYTSIKSCKLCIAGVTQTSQVRAFVFLSLPIVEKRKVRSRYGIQCENFHINFHED